MTGKVTKLKLKDLIGQELKANADLHKDDPKKHAHHVSNRTSRYRMITPRGSEHTRTLAGDAKKDILLNELAREFVNNGMRKIAAIASTFGLSRQTARGRRDLMDVFESSWFRAKVSQMLQGADGEFAEVPKEYAVQRMINILEMNILDYVGNDGRYLTMEELKRLPRELQLLLDDFTMVNTVRSVALTTPTGAVVRDADGEPLMVEVKDQTVRLKLPDKLKAVEMLAKFQQWIQTHGDTNVIIDAGMMARAHNRVKELSRDAEDIEGKARRITAD